MGEKQKPQRFDYVHLLASFQSLHPLALEETEEVAAEQMWRKAATADENTVLNRWKPSGNYPGMSDVIQSRC